MIEPKIIAVTQPRVEREGRTLSAGEFIAYVARVSNASNQLNVETAPRLLKYLAAHGHWSPFQLVSLTMDITTTRDISHQLIRHWSFDDVGSMNVQEFSQRYATVDSEAYSLRECRMQDGKNRQSSLPADADAANWWELAQYAVLGCVKRWYQLSLERGIAKEVARSLLPEGLTLTRLYVSGTLRSWIHFCGQRCQEDTQKEHRDLARQCWLAIVAEFPDLKDLVTWDK